MAGKNDIVAGIRLEGDQQFKSSVTSVNKTVTSLRSELNLVKAQYDGNQNSMEALTKKAGHGPRPGPAAGAVSGRQCPHPGAAEAEGGGHEAGAGERHQGL